MQRWLPWPCTQRMQHSAGLIRMNGTPSEHADSQQQQRQGRAAGTALPAGSTHATVTTVLRFHLRGSAKKPPVGDQISAGEGQGRQAGVQGGFRQEANYMRAPTRGCPASTAAGAGNHGASVWFAGRKHVGRWRANTGCASPCLAHCRHPAHRAAVNGGKQRWRAPGGAAACSGQLRCAHPLARSGPRPRRPCCRFHARCGLPGRGCSCSWVLRAVPGR